MQVHNFKIARWLEPVSVNLAMRTNGGTLYI